MSLDACPRCLGELDTDWECTQCGFDAKPIVAATCTKGDPMNNEETELDKIACEAMKGLLSQHGMVAEDGGINPIYETSDTFPLLADRAYDIAECMMKESKKRAANN